MSIRRAILGKSDAQIGDVLSHYEKLDEILHNALTKESDRGLVLVAGAYFENLLGRCLEAYFVDCSEATDILKPNNGLGTFKARLQCCRALRIIDGNERTALALLAGIRNHFAHSLEAGFHSQSISDKCFDLIGLSSPINKVELRKKISPREAFLLSSFDLSNRLHRREINTLLHTAEKTDLLPSLINVDQGPTP